MNRFGRIGVVLARYLVALRMFAVPVLLGCDFLLALFAPSRGTRVRFFVAAALEGATVAFALLR